MSLKGTEDSAARSIIDGLYDRMPQRIRSSDSAEEKLKYVERSYAEEVSRGWKRESEAKYEIGVAQKAKKRLSIFFAIVIIAVVAISSAVSHENGSKMYSEGYADGKQSVYVSGSSGSYSQSSASGNVTIKKIDPKQSTSTVTVYVTNTGSKYHRDGCQYLSKSQIAISLSDAKSSGYTACSKCHPPE